jgi:hypothetical protein
MGTHSQIRLKNAVKLHEMLMAFQVLAGKRRVKRLA